MKVAGFLLSLFFCFYSYLCPAAEKLNFRILKVASHDDSSFTQGLFWESGVLFESSGLYGRSKLFRYRADTGELLNSTRIPPHLFAEGLVKRGSSLFLLTWKAQQLYEFDAQTLAPIKNYPYEGQGWGLTANKDYFIRSDGSDMLYFHKPDDFSVVTKLRVKLQGRPLRRLNELEFVDGHIWANVFRDNHLVKIQADNGEVVARADLSRLVAWHRESSSSEKVLNGIAYDANNKAFWVTGKNWPKRYLLEFYPSLENVPRLEK